MFVYSLRASSIKFFGIVALSLTALITLLILVPTYEPTAASSLYTNAQNIKYDKIKTNEDCISFLGQFGWQVSSEPTEEVKVIIPAEFDKVYLGYNEIQKQQGLNLGKYKRKEVTRYTYTVTNYPDYNGIVYANVLVYRGRVIGGDICSADVNGFIHGFVKNADTTP